MTKYLWMIVFISKIHSTSFHPVAKINEIDMKQKIMHLVTITRKEDAYVPAHIRLSFSAADANSW